MIVFGDEILSSSPWIEHNDLSQECQADTLPREYIRVFIWSVID